MKITLQEALNNLNKKLELPINDNPTDDNSPIRFFSEMDKNQDGVIDPKEFDKYLDEDIMKQYQNLYYEIL